MLDTLLFSTFLATNLILGLFHSRQVATMRDYSVGRKDFSTATLVSTILATGLVLAVACCFGISSIPIKKGCIMSFQS